MAEELNNSKRTPIERVNRGGGITAAGHNQIVDVVNRMSPSVSSPRQIRNPPQISAALRLCILREYASITDTDGPYAKVQEITYSGSDDDKLEGEEDLGGHIVAVGDVFNVKPFPGMTWAAFNIEGGERRAADAADPENLAGAPVLWVDARGWAWWADTFIPDMGMLNPSTENSQGGGA